MSVRQASDPRGLLAGQAPQLTPGAIRVECVVMAASRETLQVARVEVFWDIPTGYGGSQSSPVDEAEYLTMEHFEALGMAHVGEDWKGEAGTFRILSSKPVPVHMKPVALGPVLQDQEEE